MVDNPPPNVIFQDFGASSLDFELRVFVNPADYVIIVASELRFAIFKKLKEAGIEIPFPQRDVNIKDIDRLEAALTARKDEPPENDPPPRPAGRKTSKTAAKKRSQ